jgi:hypothetical protein
MIPNNELRDPNKKPREIPKCGNNLCNNSVAIWKWSEAKYEWFIMCQSCRKVHWIPKHQRQANA